MKNNAVKQNRDDVGGLKLATEEGGFKTEDDEKLFSQPEAPDDALAQIFRFHGEIRAALSLLESVVDLNRSTARERKCARFLIHFFSGPLVWHDIDEECSLLPRLRDRVYAEGNELDIALHEICDEHTLMESLIEEVLPHLDVIASGHAAPLALTGAADRLRRHLLPHLAREERYLLPFARLVLSPFDLSSLDDEMAIRKAARASPESLDPPWES